MLPSNSGCALEIVLCKRQFQNCTKDATASKDALAECSYSTSLEFSAHQMAFPAQPCPQVGRDSEIDYLHYSKLARAIAQAAGIFRPQTWKACSKCANELWQVVAVVGVSSHKLE